MDDKREDDQDFKTAWAQLSEEEKAKHRAEVAAIFKPRELTPEEKQRAEEEKKRDEPSIGEQLLYVMKSEAQKVVATSLEFQTGKPVRAGGKIGRAAQKRKRSIGIKADEGKVSKAQATIDRVNAAAQLWAGGNRSKLVKDQLAFRGAKEQDDGTVRITRNGMLDYVARAVAVPSRTLYGWVEAGHLANVPPSSRKKS